MTDYDHALARAYATAFAGHAHADVRTRNQLEEFLDLAASMHGPSGERSTGEIGPADTDQVDIEFALFDDRAFLRHRDTFAVEARFLDTAGNLPDKTELDPAQTRLVHNPMDQVEPLPPERLLCTPGWVRRMVAQYAQMGAIPDKIHWFPIFGD